MSELVPLLGTLAVLLTLIGSYRLFGFFFDKDPIFAGVFAITTTVVFLVILDILLLGLGSLALLSPVGLAYYSGHISLPSLPNRMPTETSDTEDSGKIKCSNCGAKNEVYNRHCDNCGELL